MACVGGTPQAACLSLSGGESRNVSTASFLPSEVPRICKWCASFYDHIQGKVPSVTLISEYRHPPTWRVFLRVWDTGVICEQAPQRRQTIYFIDWSLSLEIYDTRGP